MRVGNERSDVAMAVGTPALLVLLFDPRVPLLHLARPARVIALVDRVAAAAQRAADVRMGEEELAHVRVEGKGMHAVPGGQNENGAGAIKGVAGGDDLVPGAERVFEGG